MFSVVQPILRFSKSGVSLEDICLPGLLQVGICLQDLLQGHLNLQSFLLKADLSYDASCDNFNSTIVAKPCNKELPYLLASDANSPVPQGSLRIITQALLLAATLNLPTK